MKLNKKENQLLWRIVAAAWIDPDFRNLFLRDPKAVLQKAGLPLAGIALVTITVLQSGLPEIAIKGKRLEIAFPPVPIELAEMDVMAEMDIAKRSSVFVSLKFSCC